MIKSQFDTTLSLVKEAQRGESGAMAQLCERYLPRVREIVALRLKRSHPVLIDEDDLVQEAFVIVLEELSGFKVRSEGTFRNFISRCVQNKLTDIVRKEKAQKRGGGRVKHFTDVIPEDLGSSIFAGKLPTPSQILNAKELSERIHDAMLHLDEHHREIIIQRKLCGMSYAEVARAMGFKRQETARLALKRALDQLRTLVEV